MRTRGPSANSRPILRGRLAIRSTSLANEYRRTLNPSVGPLGSRINRIFRVVVPSSRLFSARSSASSFADLFLPVLVEVEVEVEAVGVGRAGVRGKVVVEGGWEKTSMWVTPSGPDMETKSLSRLAFLSCANGNEMSKLRKKCDTKGKGRTLSLVPVLGSRTFLTSLTREATDPPTVPDLITIDFGTFAAVGSFAASAGWTCVRVFFRFDPLRRGIFLGAGGRRTREQSRFASCVGKSFPSFLPTLSSCASVDWIVAPYAGDWDGRGES